jgi:benzoylformate decarboxylase
MSSRKSANAASAALTVKEATFGLLRAFGIKRVFGNPGSTELPFLSDWPDDMVPPRLIASLRIAARSRI